MEAYNHIFRLIILMALAICIYVWLYWFIEPEEWEDDLAFIKSFNDDKVKRIVFWTTFFGAKRWGTKGEIRSSITCGQNATCQLYSSRRYPLLYDAFVFHIRDYQQPPKERTPKQIYIILSHESPVYGGDYFIKGDNFYNMSVTYSSKSDFVQPYFHFRKRTPGFTYNESSLPLPQMSYTRHSGEAMVLWIVSHCETHSKREVYVELLKHHINIDIYGKCGNSCESIQKESGLQCHEALMKTGRYKFYLSFENSACRDYFTEKVHVPLRLGLVPVVYGGLSSDGYRKILPPNSFIDVRNFSSPEHLAQYLHYLDKNDKAYLSYQEWRRDWEFDQVYIWCDVCLALHNISNIKPQNVNWEMFWNPDTECDSKLVDKVSGTAI